MKPSKVEVKKSTKVKPDKAKIKSAKTVKELAAQVELLADLVNELLGR